LHHEGPGQDEHGAERKAQGGHDIDRTLNLIINSPVVNEIWLLRSQLIRRDTSVWKARESDRLCTHEKSRPTRSHWRTKATFLARQYKTHQELL
jgi:hypothetical protein